MLDGSISTFKHTQMCLAYHIKTPTSLVQHLQSPRFEFQAELRAIVRRKYSSP